MPRVLECPRCGAGIGHNDTQCWRCGEPVKGGSGSARLNALSMGKTPGPAIRDLRNSKNKEVPRTQPMIRPIVEPYNGREKELADREREVRETMAALEAEAKELEAAAAELEKERLSLKEARDRVMRREEELDAKAILLEDILTVTQEIKADGPATLSEDDREVPRRPEPSWARCWTKERSGYAGRWREEMAVANSPASISWRWSSGSPGPSWTRSPNEPAIDISRVLSQVVAEMRLR